MCIMQKMLWCYVKKIVDANPLKSKTMKLACIKKEKLNINGTTHFALAIPLNKNHNELNALANED